MSLFGKLERQVAVVTGSSSGIGRAIALELARAGADLIVHARSSRQAAEEVVEQIRSLGREATLLLADLEDAQQHPAIVEQAWTSQRPIDIWVNNAGADVLTGARREASFEEKLEQLWRVDVRATVNLSRLAGCRMKARGHGVILNMGWDQAALGMAGESGQMFAAAKGAIMAFSRSLAKSLAPEVRVNCLAPGWIRTAWGGQASEYWQQRAKSECLLQRWGTPEDVARAARFLASDAAEFITDVVVPINGGFKTTT